MLGCCFVDCVSVVIEGSHDCDPVGDRGDDRVGFGDGVFVGVGVGVSGGDGIGGGGGDGDSVGWW